MYKWRYGYARVDWTAHFTFVKDAQTRCPCTEGRAECPLASDHTVNLAVSMVAVDNAVSKIAVDHTVDNAVSMIADKRTNVRL